MKVYSSPNLAMVGHLKNVLELRGIVCSIRGEFGGAAMGLLPPIQCWPELWIMDKSQAEEARQIIKEALGPDEGEPAHWKCPRCEEDVEGQFDVCWKCGTNRPEAEDA